MLSGIWLPIITPFRNDKIDYVSYRRLINYYIEKGISGIIPLGTTGEAPTIEEEEYERLISSTMEFVGGRVPVYVGLGGNSTKKVSEKLKMVEGYKADGILSVCPYYNRPDQKGIYEHFLRISQSTSLNIIIYNIPYRTGRNIENDTLFKLAEEKNIIGVKDSCGDIKQSMSLILNAPEDFSVMTGEDILLYSTLLLGGQGGILASAHLNTSDFINIYRCVQTNDFKGALETWKRIYGLIPLLFEEPNPAPIKYCLKELKLIESDEIRLPLSNISESLKLRLNKKIGL